VVLEVILVLGRQLVALQACIAVVDGTTNDALADDIERRTSIAGITKATMGKKNE